MIQNPFTNYTTDRNSRMCGQVRRNPLTQKNRLPSHENWQTFFPKKKRKNAIFILLLKLRTWFSEKEKKKKKHFRNIFSHFMKI